MYRKSGLNTCFLVVQMVVQMVVQFFHLHHLAVFASKLICTTL